MSGGDRRRANPALVAALAGGATVQDASKQAGVGEATVYRRLREPAFRAEVAEARARMLGETIGKLVRVSTAAAMTLALLMKDEQAPAIRLGAARAILGTVVDLRTHEELDQRISALEAALGGDK